MRESIGGAWLFGIVIVFIFLFSAFLSYSISYTKAFNVKNEIISYIEQNEGYTFPNDGTEPENMANTDDLLGTVKGKIYYYIYRTGYDYSHKDDNNFCKALENGKVPENVYGTCISKICSNPEDKISDVHYKVESYINLEIPIIGARMTIPISGETRLIYKDQGMMECTNAGL